MRSLLEEANRVIAFKDFSTTHKPELIVHAQKIHGYLRGSLKYGEILDVLQSHRSLDELRSYLEARLRALPPYADGSIEKNEYDSLTLSVFQSVVPQSGILTTQLDVREYGRNGRLARRRRVYDVGTNWQMEYHYNSAHANLTHLTALSENGFGYETWLDREYENGAPVCYFRTRFIEGIPYVDPDGNLALLPGDPICLSEFVTKY